MKTHRESFTRILSKYLSVCLSVSDDLAIVETFSVVSNQNRKGRIRFLDCLLAEP